MKRFLVVLAAVVLCVGCRGRRDVNEVLQEADRLMKEGSPVEAAGLLEEALQEESYAEQHPRLFALQLDAWLQADSPNEARDRYLAVIGRDGKLARAGFGKVMAYYRSGKDDRSLAEWSAKLVDSPLPDDLAQIVFSMHLRSLVAAGTADQAVAQIDSCVKRFDAPSAARILWDLVSFAAASRPAEEVGKLCDEIERVAAGVPELRRMAAMLRVDLALRGERWDEVERRLEAAEDELGENEFRPLVVRVAGTAVQRGQWDVADRVCESAINGPGVSEATLVAMGTQWVRSARVRGLAGEVVSRLQALRAKSLPAHALLRLYLEHFYFVAGAGDAEHTRALLDMALALSGESEDERMQAQVGAMTLDGAFLLEDYDLALSTVESGLSGRDKDWHEMAANKIKAHIALRDGRTTEAVKRFEQFMADIDDSWDKPEEDPSTGLRHTREMTLAFNAKRIGDILAKAGNTGDARASYERAGAYYREALETLDAESREYGHVQRELAAIPAAAPADAGPPPEVSPQDK